MENDFMRFRYETERLSLQVLNEISAEHSLEFYSAGSYLFNQVEPAKPMDFYTMNYQRALLRSEYQSFLDGSYIRYYFYRLSDPDRIIGTASFSHIDKGVYRSCIIGYKLLPEFHKQGYALEALATLISAIFAEDHIHRIEAFVLPDNIASINLLTRLGFECEGTARSIIRLNNGYVDHLRYVLINPMD